jgi:hypothetical protein
MWQWKPFANRLEHVYVRTYIHMCTFVRGVPNMLCTSKPKKKSELSQTFVSQTEGDVLKF